jgi:hypothetical protein
MLELCLPANKYIKTEADDYQPNNLVSLPECH